MVLSIDIGNTNITFGWFDDGGTLSCYANIFTDKLQTTDDLALTYNNLLQLNNINKSGVKSVVISSVVPQLNYPFLHMFDKYHALNAQIITNKEVPIQLNYDFPAEIGADRIVNAYAGIRDYPAKNLIIVDFGTATTFDIVSSRGCYEGGVIFPGMMTSLRSLGDKASKLPHIDLGVFPPVVAKNTIDGIRSGLLHGTGAMMDEMNRRIAKEMKWQEYMVIATGGLSELIMQTSESIDALDKHLTLKGLFYLGKLKNAS